MKAIQCLLLVLGTLAAVGCQTQNPLSDENAALRQQNQDLQSRLDADEQRLKAAPDPSQIQAMQADLAARDQKIAALQAQLREPAPNADPSIAGIETSYDARAGTMTVTLPGDVLFDSGQATLKLGAQSTLAKVASALKEDYAGKSLRVEGHTDSDPISRTKDQWDDNLDLSLTRAAAVTRYLIEQGISPKLITTSGFGEHRPRSGNKARNRRVEIVVVVR